MDSFRKWFYRPKKDDKSLLAQFFFADEALNMVASELDSFDGRKDPLRCMSLVNQLRQSQNKVLTITSAIMDVLIEGERANRDFRAKFPEDVLQENLSGQLWFGAECLAAGSSIMNRESESTAMRPLAKAVTRSLETVRNLIREACLRNNTPNGPIKLDNNELVTEMLLESLKIFDRLFAEFEFAYVSAMVPVKSTQEFELQELISVLFSETLQRGLRMKLLTQDMVDACDPALMFTIPRLGIVGGLLVFPNGPLCIDKPYEDMSEMFRPFRTLLRKIRALLWTLDKRELFMLEKLLCDNEEITDIKSFDDFEMHHNLDDFVSKFYEDFPSCKGYTSSFYVRSTESVNKDFNDTKENTPSTSSHFINEEISVSKESLLENEEVCLKAISAAAATLSTILSDQEACTERNTFSPESPDDSGICTENTSLDRSPVLDSSNSNRNCETVRCNKRSFHDSNVHKAVISKLPLPTIKQQSSCGNSSDEDTSSLGSSDTSSFDSTYADDEEIAMAMQAAEFASRSGARSKYRSSEDLIHRLFVCIAGVADQLQTNFASDLRNILKSVFLMNTPENNHNENLTSGTVDVSIEYHPAANEIIENNEFSVDPNILAQEALFDSNVYFQINENDAATPSLDYLNHPRQLGSDVSSLATDFNHYVTLRDDVTNLHTGVSQSRTNTQETPPVWIPDEDAPKCMSCGTNFTVVKRRHHCRNCGKVFCARCSSNSLPLPKFGHTKPVRVCNKCFMYQLTPFTM